MFEPSNLPGGPLDGLSSSDWLVRTAAISAAVLLISLGLCGINFALVLSSGDRGPGFFLAASSYIEIFGMAAGASGLAFSAVALTVRTIYRLFTRPRDTP